MRFLFAILLAVLGLAACTTVEENPDPLKNVPFERTSRLLEMREGLKEKNTNYLNQKGDRLDRNTNKRNMGELKDEYARWDMRAQFQIERELAKRYQAGDSAAHFPGIEQYVSPGTATPSPTPSPAPVPQP
jgi:hypothetical protein